MIGARALTGRTKATIATTNRARINPFFMIMSLLSRQRREYASRGPYIRPLGVLHI
jgi:hypothetical protein